ncbi:MAG: zf-HC2 domain-containing protein [Acidobacteriota bacterium]|jgi:predicted anti-sigma-YlaC factor YlaD
MKEFFKCQECVDLLTDYLEGNLEPQVREKLDEHLAGCAPCINFVRSFEKSTTMLHLLKEQRVDVPSDVQARLKNFLREEIVALSTERNKD